MAKKNFLLSAIQTCSYPLFGNFNTPLSHLLPFNNNVTINHDRLIQRTSRHPLSHQINFEYSLSMKMLVLTQNIFCTINRIEFLLEYNFSS